MSGNVRTRQGSASGWSRRFGLLALALALVSCGGEAVDPSAVDAARAKAAPAEREWRRYLGDLASRQWSPLARVDRTNVHLLERAWTYEAGTPETGGLQMQVNPIVVEGVLYGVSPNLVLFALDASTGDELWRFDPGTGSWLASSSRGVAWWREGDDERILFGARSFLYAIEARTGRPVARRGPGGAGCAALRR